MKDQKYNLSQVNQTITRLKNVPSNTQQRRAQQIAYITPLQALTLPPHHPCLLEEFLPLSSM
jgi:hypothetical protein